MSSCLMLDVAMQLFGLPEIGFGHPSIDRVIDWTEGAISLDVDGADGNPVASAISSSTATAI